jgi:phage terminase Nu1 subunit (DNA packaging protein)
MIKYQEISDPNSCWNKARNGERVFVLLARDISTPKTIRDWAAERIRLGKNKPDDEQIKEALEQADLIEAELRVHGKI